MPVLTELRKPWHGAPAWVWAVGGGLVLGIGYGIHKRRRAAQNAAAQPADTQGYGYGYGAPLPGYAGLGGALGGSSPSGPLIGYDGSGNPVYGVGGELGQTEPPGWFVDFASSFFNKLATTIQPPPPAPAPPPPAPSVAPPAPVVSSGTPANAFSIGQSLGLPGERVVSSIFSPVIGWLNASNYGGVYTGGGGSGQLPGAQSYLGYLDLFRAKYGSAAAQAEQAGHGTFGANALSLVPGGYGYTLTNVGGEKYTYVPGT